MRRNSHHPWPTTRYWQPAGRTADFDPPDADRPDRSRLALALGVVSLLFAPLGVIAWAFASACLKDIADGRMDPAGESNARAGRVLGMIATGLFVFKVTVFVPLYWFVG